MKTACQARVGSARKSRRRGLLRLCWVSLLAALVLGGRLLWQTGFRSRPSRGGGGGRRRGHPDTFDACPYRAWRPGRPEPTRRGAGVGGLWPYQRARCLDGRRPRLSLHRGRWSSRRWYGDRRPPSRRRRRHVLLGRWRRRFTNPQRGRTGDDLCLQYVPLADLRLPQQRRFQLPPWLLPDRQQRPVRGARAVAEFAYNELRLRRMAGHPRWRPVHLWPHRRLHHRVRGAWRLGRHHLCQ